MWYKKANEVDFNTPIFATKESRTLILLPQHLKHSYEVTGYDWFDVNAGDYNSSCVFETTESAIESRTSSGWSIFNRKLTGE